MKNKIFIICLLFIFAGCSKVEDKGKITEKGTNKPNSPIVSEVKEDDTKWPQNEWTRLLPEFTKGTNHKVHTNNKDGFVFGSYNVTDDEYNSYLKDLKTLGFENNVIEITEGNKSFQADKDGYQVTITFFEGYMSITLIKIKELIVTP